MNIQTRMNNEGFSILGVMISSSLLMLALYGAEQGLSYGSQFNAHQHLLTQGLHVGQSVMESLMLTSSTDPSLAPGTHKSLYDGDSRLSNSAGPFTATWTVTTDDPYPTIERILLNVSWNESGTTRSISLTTFRN